MEDISLLPNLAQDKGTNIGSYWEHMYLVFLQ